jgi:glycosyltransferase involved in cell wall biosynthesis
VGDAQGLRPDPVLVLNDYRRTARTIRDVIRNAHAEPEVQGEPLVTVVLSTYNWSSVLRHSVRSVLWQTYPNLELLVIGDGCTDDSEEVIASFADDRVRWHNLSSNSGSQATPNNVGIENAQGSYIAYQGHDDLWHPKHLATMLAHMQRADADLAYNLAELIGPPGSRMRLLSGRGRNAQLPEGRWLPPNSLMHRTALARRLGGWRTWEDADRPPDVDFLDRARAVAKRFIRVPAMTAFKLAASWRRNVYRDRPSHEQEALMRRIESERWFTERELAAWALGRLLRRAPDLPSELENIEDPMALRAWSRKVRGLD